MPRSSTTALLLLHGQVIGIAKSEVGVKRIVHGGLQSACIDAEEAAACVTMAKALGVEVIQLETSSS